VEQNQEQDTNQEQIPPSLPLLREEKEAADLRVAYHEGPADIGFCGRQWQRDVAQRVTAEEWAAMQARGDFGEFNFEEEK
jgi:hypothetical protein